MNEEIERKDLEVLWTVEQVAKYFTISKRTVYQWLSNEKVFDQSKLVRIGNLVRIPRSEVERIANAKKAAIVKVAPTPARPATPLK